jgi:putative intracellular protease/amidase
MASSYSTDLKLELMVTGENAGTWGDNTNNNLNLVQQAVAGYEAISIAGGVGTTALAMTDATLSNARNAVIKFTGSITGNRTVTIPDSIQKTYLLENGTTGAYTVAFKTVSGTGVTFSATDKGFKQVFSDGTNVVDVPLGVPGGSNTEIQFNNSDSFGGSANLIWDGTNVVLGSEGELRLGDNAGAEYVGLKAPATVSASYTLNLPTATGTADQILVTDGSGNLSFVDNSGGTSWQAVKTTGFTAVAGEGYFINTTSGAFTMTLPSSPAIGAEVSFVDYAGTFDTNELTIARNSQPIQGAASDLTVSVERAANTLVYVDGTQGWLLKTK